MTAKEHLSMIRQLDIKIGQRLAALDELRDIATSIGSFDYGKDRVQTSPNGEAPYARTAELAVEIDTEVAALIAQKQDIINQIMALAPKHADLLYKRYVEYKRLEAIASEMHYALSYVWQLHSEALNEFELHSKT